MSQSLPATARMQTSAAADLVVISRGPAAPGDYEIMPGTGIGEVRRRRDVATSPYVHGGVEISSVRDERQFFLNVRCVGTDWANTCALRNAVIDAGQQRSWILRYAIGGVLEVWQCYAVDYSAPITTEMAINLRIEVSLTIPIAKRLV